MLSSVRDEETCREHGHRCSVVATYIASMHGPEVREVKLWVRGETGPGEYAYHVFACGNLRFFTGPIRMRAFDL